MTSTTEPEQLAEYFDVDEIAESAEEVEPRYNVAPSQEILVIAQHDGARRLGTMKWGLVPFYSKNASGGARMINARASTVATKAAYKRIFERRRCIIPADGFYEWEPIEGKKTKQPWYFTLKSGEPLGFAGLWDVWREPSAGDAPRLVTCTIITTDANSDVSQIHDRMPRVLTRDEWAEWLDVGRDAHDLLKPAPSGALDAIRVSTLVNSAANDGAELIATVD